MPGLCLKVKARACKMNEWHEALNCGGGGGGVCLLYLKITDINLSCIKDLVTV